VVEPVVENDELSGERIVIQRLRPDVISPPKKIPSDLFRGPRTSSGDSRLLA